MRDFLRTENERLQKFLTDWNQAVWMVNTTGKKHWQTKEVEAEAAYRRYSADSKRFAKIKEGLAESTPGSLEERQYQRLYQEALPNQLDAKRINRMVQLSSDLSNRFNTFRATIDGKKITENEVRRVLLHSRDLTERKKVWLASKQIGEEVAAQLVQLVKERNEAAQSLGYENHYQMMLELQELDEREVFSLFQSVKENTDELFRKVKQEMDEELREKYGLKEETLRPWHYMDPFFQEAPAVPGSDLSPYLQEQSLEQLTTTSFQALGMEIETLLAKSDLYERDQKNQHAFCLDVDHEGDIRVLANLQPNQYWMDTMLHEFGHAVYDKNIDPELPFLLRTHAHILTTEAVAMHFGKMIHRREWLEKFLKLPSDVLDELMPKQERMLQRQSLVIARWILTFVSFERELYRNPDQDLSALWWKLVQEIQYMEPPEETRFPHWAAKIHLTIAPVYYQNYLLGELMASQLDAYIQKHISTERFCVKTGRFFLEKVFHPGDRSDWRGLIQGATGEPLQAEYFIHSVMGLGKKQV